LQLSWTVLPSLRMLRRGKPHWWQLRSFRMQLVWKASLCFNRFILRDSFWYFECIHRLLIAPCVLKNMLGVCLTFTRNQLEVYQDW
jgi:hypothetical protein